MAFMGHVVSVIQSVTVEPVLLLFMFSSSLTFSAFMAMTYDKSCLTLYNVTLCDAMNANKTFSKQHHEEGDAIQHLASAWIMRGNIAITVPATVSLLLWMGSVGDRVGRRLPLVIPCTAAILYSIANIVNAVYMNWSLIYTLVGLVISGMGGTYLAVLMAGYTYLTHKVARGAGMVRVGVAESSVFLSSTVSVFVSGRSVDTLGYTWTFAIALTCQCMALLYTIFILPDLKTEETTAKNDADKPPCCPGVWLNAPRDMWRFLNTARAKRVKVHLALFFVVLNILQLCTTGEMDILMLYLKRSPRNWSYTKYGYFKGAENFTRGMAVLVLLPLLKKLLAPRDTILILAGLVSKMGALILLGLARETWTIFLVVGVASLQGFPSAGLRSLMAAMVEKQEQGRLFGLLASTECVTTLVSTLFFNNIYPKTLDFYDGLCFQLAAGFVFICFIIIACQHVSLKTTDADISDVISCDITPHTLSKDVTTCDDTSRTSPKDVTTCRNDTSQKSPKDVTSYGSFNETLSEHDVTIQSVTHTDVSLNKHSHSDVTDF